MQSYCFHCMKPLNGSAICPYCHRNGSFVTSAPYHLKPGTVLAKRYLLGDVIGEGGFGITYIGLDQTLAKRVAIKEFYPSGAANRTGELSDGVVITRGREEFFQKGVDRFLVEAKSVAAFSDEDGIVDVLDHFRANNTAYIVMEYLDGENLRDYVNHHGLFKSDDLIALMMPVMKSLKAMHAKGVIHRDISPDNIMFTKNKKLKLMDFGSARYYTNEERKMSVILKKGYAPEEQYRSNGVQGPFTDVYALCATIYACITGKEPEESLDRLNVDTLISPSRLGISISAAHEQALMHGLAVRAENRCADMNELIRELSGNGTRTIAADDVYYSQNNNIDYQQNGQNQYYKGKMNGSNGGYGGYGSGYGGGSANWNQFDYYNQQTQPQKSNTPIIVAIIVSVTAILAVGGVIAFLMLSDNGSSKGDSSSYASAISDQPTIPTSSPSGANQVYTEPVSTDYPTTEPPETTQPPTTQPPTTTSAKHTLSEAEINQIINDQIVPRYIADVDDNKRMNEVRSGGEYDYALCPNNRIWVGTKGSFHDDSQIKRWYFFDENHKLYFAFERTADTELRYYVYNDEVIKLTVGIHDVQKQTKYYQGDSAIDESIQSIVSDSYRALNTIN